MVKIWSGIKQVSHYSADTTKFYASNIGTSSQNYGANVITTVNGQKVLVIVNLSIDFDTSEADIECWIRRDSTNISDSFHVGNNSDSSYYANLTIALVDTPGAGTHYYYARVRADEANTDIDSGSVTVIALS